MTSLTFSDSSHANTKAPACLALYPLAQGYPQHADAERECESCHRFGDTASTMDRHPRVEPGRRASPDDQRSRGFIHSEPDATWLQTSAAVSGGNSGGPMLDPPGKAIGVIEWTSRGQAINFGVPVASLCKLRAFSPVSSSVHPARLRCPVSGDSELEFEGVIGKQVVEASHRPRSK